MWVPPIISTVASSSSISTSVARAVSAAGRECREKEGIARLSDSVVGVGLGVGGVGVAVVGPPPASEVVEDDDTGGDVERAVPWEADSGGERWRYCLVTTRV